MEKHTPMPKKKKITDAVELIDLWYGKKPGFRQRVEEVRQKRVIGDLLREARKARGLSQAQLAKIARTSQSAIARIEDANYTGQKLSTITKIAAALNRRVEIRLQPVKVKMKA